MSRGALAGATALAIALLGIATGHAPSAAAAACGSSGVTVIVDPGTSAGSRTSTRCAPGDPASGLAALRGSGHALTFVPRQPGFVCTIDQVPASCNGAPPDAYWSYWTAKRGGSWSYSTAGAGSHDPAPGTVEGWAFGAGSPPRARPPAAVAPTRRPSPTPTTRPVPSTTRPARPSPTTRPVPATRSSTTATSRGSAARSAPTSTRSPAPASTSATTTTAATTAATPAPTAATTPTPSQAPTAPQSTTETTQAPTVAAAGTPTPAEATTFSSPAPASPATDDTEGGLRLWSATLLVGMLAVAAGLTSYGRRRGRR